MEMNAKVDTGFSYIGRLPCGCCMSICVDYMDKSTAKDVADFIASGLTVERVSDTDLEERVFKEPTFFKCPHQAKQSKLF